VNEKWVLKCYGGNNVACPEEIILYVISKERCSWEESLAKIFESEKSASEFARRNKIGWAFTPEKIE